MVTNEDSSAGLDSTNTDSTNTDSTDTNSTDIVKLNAERAAWRNVGEELVVLDLESSSYLSINQTGTAVWPLLETGTTRADMVSSILDEFEVDRETAEADLARFIDDLAVRGLLLSGD